MLKNFLTISVLSISLYSQGGFFSSKELIQKNFNKVLCKEVNELGGPVSVKALVIRLQKLTNLRRISGEQSLRGDLFVELLNGQIFKMDNINFKRSGGGQGRNRLADELTARLSMNGGNQWIELLLAAPTKEMYEDDIYSSDTDLTGGINIAADDINIWLDDQIDSEGFKDPLRCTVSIQ
ncbi:hypothetical protein M899_1004 [Bacteriovorax sp. BSW11_IV]|uniref:hypothetical protein n=1 Tax=Bacteriovorax sp. BSW11_IV TaxID=1353529 RepID=UPI00038A5596|nr:hypothetical protein [Bacteriovorax sp. BSW11_IV]EQC48689.1 hypothetical protein M899_1004 [Bacteriovorax sp. BSW11_IV]